MFCHNKPLFRARPKGLGRFAHSFYTEDFTVYLTNKEALTVLCSVVKHAGSG